MNATYHELEDLVAALELAGWVPVQFTGPRGSVTGMYLAALERYTVFVAEPGALAHYPCLEWAGLAIAGPVLFPTRAGWRDVRDALTGFRAHGLPPEPTQPLALEGPAPIE